MCHPFIRTAREDCNLELQCFQLCCSHIILAWCPSWLSICNSHQIPTYLAWQRSVLTETLVAKYEMRNKVHIQAYSTVVLSGRFKISVVQWLFYDKVNATKTWNSISVRVRLQLETPPNALVTRLKLRSLSRYHQRGWNNDNRCT